jgi:hypothetical protein
MRFLYVWFQTHSIIFGLMQFGTDDPWQHLSHVGGQQKVTSLSCHQSRVWFDYNGDKSHSWCSSLFNSTGFCYQNEKCKSTSPSAIQLKNWQKTISTEEKLDVISRFEKGEHIADICCMLLILAYEKFMIMLTELQEVLWQELKCLCSKTTTALFEWTVPESVDCLLLHFDCIMNN